MGGNRMNHQKKLLIRLVIFFSVTITIICLCIAQIITDITTDPIKVEVINYVLENKDTPEFEQYKTRYDTYYTSTGYWDASVEYGFYYEEEDIPRTANSYGNGYRYSYGSIATDWRYEEQICEHWYYYEIHYG